MVAGMAQVSLSAILTMVLRKILPERVFGGRETMATSLKAATVTQASIAITALLSNFAQESLDDVVSDVEPGFT